MVPQGKLQARISYGEHERIVTSEWTAQRFRDLLEIVHENRSGEDPEIIRRAYDVSLSSITRPNTRFGRALPGASA